MCVFMIFIFNKENNKTNKIMENDTDIQREIEWDTFNSTDSNTSTQEKTSQEEKNKQIVIYSPYMYCFSIPNKVSNFGFPREKKS